MNTYTSEWFERAKKKEEEKTERFSEAFSEMRRQRAIYSQNIGKEWQQKKEERRIVEQERQEKTKEFLNYNLECAKGRQ